MCACVDPARKPQVSFIQRLTTTENTLTPEISDRHAHCPRSHRPTSQLGTPCTPDRMFGAWSASRALVAHAPPHIGHRVALPRLRLRSTYHRYARIACRSSRGRNPAQHHPIQISSTVSVLVMLWKPLCRMGQSNSDTRIEIGALQVETMYREQAWLRCP